MNVRASDQDCAFSCAAFALLSAASFASLSGLLHLASIGGSEIPSSRFNSLTSCSHRFSQYTVITLLARLPQRTAHGTYTLNSLWRRFGWFARRRGPKSAERCCAP